MTFDLFLWQRKLIITEHVLSLHDLPVHYLKVRRRIPSSQVSATRLPFVSDSLTYAGFPYTCVRLGYFLLLVCSGLLGIRPAERTLRVEDSFFFPSPCWYCSPHFKFSLLPPCLSKLLNHDPYPITRSVIPSTESDLPAPFRANKQHITCTSILIGTVWSVL